MEKFIRLFTIARKIVKGLVLVWCWGHLVRIAIWKVGKNGVRNLPLAKKMCHKHLFAKCYMLLQTCCRLLVYGNANIFSVVVGCCVQVTVDHDGQKHRYARLPRQWSNATKQSSKRFCTTTTQSSTVTLAIISPKFWFKMMNFEKKACKLKQLTS